MFSIIVPIFNKANYIERCLKSIFNQTFKNYEVIVINDGSTDDSLGRIKNFKIKTQQNFKIIDQYNTGVSTARNNGVKAAKYTYIAFLDADDWWEPNYLEEMNNLIISFPHAGIYGSSYFLVKNKIKNVATVGVSTDFLYGIINYCQVYANAHCMPLWVGATVIPKSVFETENGFKPILKLGEDFDLWIRLALKYPVAFINRPLSNYNQDVDPKNRAIGKTYDITTNYLWHLDYLSEYEKVDKDLKNVLDYIRITSAYSYYLHNSFRSDAKIILDKVDWTLQPRSLYRKYYATPVWLLKLQNTFFKRSIKIKNWLLLLFR